MTPLEGPDIPGPPFDIPIPDTPPANFATISAQLKAGEKSSGFWDWLLDKILCWIPDLISTILGFLFGCFGTVVAFVLQAFAKARETGEFGVQAVAAATVSDLFGVPVGAGDFGRAGGSANRQGTADSLVNAVLKGMGVAGPTGGTATIPPSSAGAKKMLGMCMNLAVEGWLEGFLFEILSAGQVETFAELKDILAHALGMGHMAHSSIAPGIAAFIHTPYTQSINQTYTPTLLAPAEMVRAYLRGSLDRTALDAALALHGYNPNLVTTLIDQYRIHMTPAEWSELIIDKVEDIDHAVKGLQQAGYDSVTAGEILGHMTKQPMVTVARAGVGFCVEAYATRKMTYDEMYAYVSKAHIGDEEKSEWLNLAEVKFKAATHLLTIAQAEQLVEIGRWDFVQFHDLALSLGYSEDNELDLEHLLISKIATKSDADQAKSDRVKAAKQRAADAAAAKKAKHDQAVRMVEDFGVSNAQYVALVLGGHKTVGDYVVYLNNKGIAADNVQALADELNAKLAKAASATASKPAAGAKLKVKNLSVGQLEAAVKTGAISLAEYDARLVDAGITQADADLLTSVLSDQIAAAKTKAAAAAAAKATPKAKTLNIAEQERAVILGIKTMADYEAALDAAGYDEADIGTLESELQAKLDQAKAAAGLTSQAQTKATAKGLNLAALEQAVRAGIKTMPNYSAALVSLGYTPDAVQTMTALLQVKVDHDAAVASAQKSAASLVQALGVSLADLRRAVVLGVVPLSTLTDALTRAKVGSEEVSLITLTTSSEAQKAAAARAKTTAAAALVAAQGLSLATVEKDAIAGKISLEQVSSILANAGVSPEDSAAIVTLVQDEADNAKALAALTAGATAKAAAKGLSLGQEQAAVKAGVKTIDDYGQFVTGLGYDAADVATLVDTLGHDLKLPGY